MTWVVFPPFFFYYKVKNRFTTPSPRGIIVFVRKRWEGTKLRRFDALMKHLGLMLDQRVEDLKAVRKVKPKTIVRDLQTLIEFMGTLRFVPASERELPLLQHGMFIDGGETVYHDGSIHDMDQDTFNIVLLNHVFHTLSGVHFERGTSVTETMTLEYAALNALYLSHFGFSNVQPRYSVSVRRELVNGTDRLVFGPHPKTASYFWAGFAQGTVRPRFLRYEVLDEFNVHEGKILKVRYEKMHLTQTGGMERYFPKSNIRDNVILTRNDDGTYELVNQGSRAGRRLIELKRVYQALTH